MIAVCVGLAEWMAGWKLTAATFWGGHILALLILTLIVTLSRHQLRAYGLEAVITARDVGPSAGYFTCLGLASGLLKRPWNWISGVGSVAILTIALLMPASGGQSAQIKFAADLAHLLAFPIGWLIAGLERIRRTRLSLQARSS